MPENTEARKRRQKRSAVIGVVAFALLQGAAPDSGSSRLAVHLVFGAGCASIGADCTGADIIKGTFSGN